MSENIAETSIYATSKGLIRCKRALCGEPFTPKRKTQHFCSKECRLVYHGEIVEAGKEALEARGRSHYARLSHSERLRRVLQLLLDRDWHTTRDIIRKADVCAVSTCVHELRLNGFMIDNKREGNIYSYRLRRSNDFKRSS